MLYNGVGVLEQREVQELREVLLDRVGLDGGGCALAKSGTLGGLGIPESLCDGNRALVMGGALNVGRGTLRRPKSLL